MFLVAYHATQNNRTCITAIITTDVILKSSWSPSHGYSSIAGVTLTYTNNAQNKANKPKNALIAYLAININILLVLLFFSILSITSLSRTHYKI